MPTTVLIDGNAPTLDHYLTPDNTLCGFLARFFSLKCKCYFRRSQVTVPSSFPFSISFLIFSNDKKTKEKLSIIIQTPNSWHPNFFFPSVACRERGDEEGGKMGVVTSTFVIRWINFLTMVWCFLSTLCLRFCFWVDFCALMLHLESMPIFMRNTFLVVNGSASAVGLKLEMLESSFGFVPFYLLLIFLLSPYLDAACWVFSQNDI